MSPQAPWHPSARPPPVLRPPMCSSGDSCTRRAPLGPGLSLGRPLFSTHPRPHSPCAPATLPSGTPHGHPRSPGWPAPHTGSRAGLAVYSQGGEGRARQVGENTGSGAPRVVWGLTRCLVGRLCGIRRYGVPPLNPVSTMASRGGSGHIRAVGGGSSPSHLPALKAGDLACLGSGFQITMVRRDPP